MGPTGAGVEVGETRIQFRNVGPDVSRGRGYREHTKCLVSLMEPKRDGVTDFRVIVKDNPSVVREDGLDLSYQS